MYLQQIESTGVTIARRGRSTCGSIDEGLRESKIGIVLVTPARFKSLDTSAVAHKDESALIDTDRLIHLLAAQFGLSAEGSSPVEAAIEVAATIDTSSRDVFHSNLPWDECTATPWSSSKAKDRETACNLSDTRRALPFLRRKGLMTSLTTEERLIKSRHRVKAHGEVFTPLHMVNKMLDLVQSELETGPDFVDTTFFEPAAGDGNFLSAILKRKLRAIEKRYEPAEWATESLFALASIYAVELLADNHEAAQAILLTRFVEFHERAGNTCSPRTNLYRSAATLVERNIICGNTLTDLDIHGEEIQFSWWHRVLDEPHLVRRDPFALASLRCTSGGNGMFDFTTYDTYAVCRIDHVYKEVRADG